MITKRLVSCQSWSASAPARMPVSSSTSRSAVAAGASSPSRLPVTDCHSPVLPARSRISTSSAGVWITTSTDTGCL